MVGLIMAQQAAAPLADNDDRQLRLRLYYGGKLEQAESGHWSYVGGKGFAASVPAAWSYGELLHHLAEKFGPVSLAWLCPGEDLEPGNLITVEDDDDLRELVSEYTAAAPACRTGRRFRLKVYLTRAEAEVYTDDDFFSEMCPFQEEDSSSGLEDVDSAFCPSCASRRHSSDSGGNRAQSGRSVAALTDTGSMFSWAPFGASHGATSDMQVLAQSSMDRATWQAQLFSDEGWMAGYSEAASGQQAAWMHKLDASLLDGPAEMLGSRLAMHLTNATNSSRTSPAKSMQLNPFAPQLAALQGAVTARLNETVPATHDKMDSLLQALPDDLDDLHSSSALVPANDSGDCGMVPTPRSTRPAIARPSGNGGPLESVVRSILSGGSPILDAGAAEEQGCLLDSAALLPKHISIFGDSPLASMQMDLIAGGGSSDSPLDDCCATPDGFAAVAQRLGGMGFSSPDSVVGSGRGLAPAPMDDGALGGGGGPRCCTQDFALSSQPGGFNAGSSSAALSLFTPAFATSSCGPDGQQLGVLDGPINWPAAAPLLPCSAAAAVAPSPAHLPFPGASLLGAASAAAAAAAAARPTMHQQAITLPQLHLGTTLGGRTTPPYNELPQPAAISWPTPAPPVPSPSTAAAASAALGGAAPAAEPALQLMGHNNEAAALIHEQIIERLLKMGTQELVANLPPAGWQPAAAPAGALAGGPFVPQLSPYVIDSAGASPGCVTPGGGGVGAVAINVAANGEGGVGNGVSAPTTPRGHGGSGGGGHGGFRAGASNKSGHTHLQRFTRSEVTVLRTLGEGAFGEVCQATVPMFGNVAIKWLKKDRVAKYAESFRKEFETLADLNHPHILRIYGYVTEGPEPDSPFVGIVTEWVRGGSLSAYLREACARQEAGGIALGAAQQAAAGGGNGGRCQPALPLRERCRLALQAANGMAYLNDKHVVHFDLKPDNLLMEGLTSCSANGGANGGGAAAAGSDDAVLLKVADFGLAKHQWHSCVSECRDLRGTLPYMAPELVTSPDALTDKVDVWSLGVCMWEMLTCEVPFEHMPAQSILSGLLAGSLHLCIPDWCEPEWRGLIEACLEYAPAARPTFRQLARHLQAILNQLDAEDDAAATAAAAAAAAAASVASASVAAAATAASDGWGGAVATGGGAGNQQGEGQQAERVPSYGRELLAY